MKRAKNVTDKNWGPKGKKGGEGNHYLPKGRVSGVHVNHMEQTGPILVERKLVQKVKKFARDNNLLAPVQAGLGAGVLTASPEVGLAAAGVTTGLVVKDMMDKRKKAKEAMARARGLQEGLFSWFKKKQEPKAPEKTVADHINDANETMKRSTEHVKSITNSIERINKAIPDLHQRIDALLATATAKAKAAKEAKAPKDPVKTVERAAKRTEKRIDRALKRGDRKIARAVKPRKHK